MIGRNTGTIFRHTMNFLLLFRTRGTLVQIINVPVVHSDNKTKTDAQLRAALKAETKEATVIIVAQRVSTVMDADRILVMDEGRIAGCGTHEELLATNEIYQQIVESQLKQGEEE